MGEHEGTRGGTGGTDDDGAVGSGGGRLEVGQRVEVRSGFDGAWHPGFVVAEVTDRGYRLRRDSDGQLLPEVERRMIRRVRKRQTWWI